MQKNSQKEAVLKCLRKTGKATLPQLMDIKVSGMRIANITARISELRDDGWIIVNERIWDKRRKHYVSVYWFQGSNLPNWK